MPSIHDTHPQPYTGWCGTHQKNLYTRKQARRAIRAMHDPGMREYPCTEVEGLWHLGHLPESVKRGNVSASEIYGVEE